jgi:hypothetical protein
MINKIHEIAAGIYSVLSSGKYKGIIAAIPLLYNPIYF